MFVCCDKSTNILIHVKGQCYKELSVGLNQCEDGDTALLRDAVERDAV